MLPAVKDFINNHKELIERNQFEALYFLAYKERLNNIAVQELNTMLLKANVVSSTRLETLKTTLFVNAFKDAIKHFYLHIRTIDSLYDLLYEARSFMPNQFGLEFDQIIPILQVNAQELKININVQHTPLDARIYYYGDF